ncbi:MAG TPA: AfsR/SARP family transcriptional regulator [Gaiellaceae bacterium]|jgi:DNA-binding SARP family transcriptional activator|nr:AfsR/SARP family transcriptional regulator [Gaiellaceae bacterium]
MEFRLLGAFEVWDNGQALEIAGLKRRALLALLVLRANEVVRSELLVDELWGERPPRNAASALQTHISRLRKTLGADTIASREWGYVLRAAPEDIDLRRFEALVAGAEQLAAQQRATKLAEALALWRGPPLADLVNEPALQHDIARLEELRLSTLERRIDADLEAGHNGNLVGELEGLIAGHPLREHLRWLLILALYRAGRQAEALEVYRETRRVLIEELGLEPSPALKELEQAILRQDPSLNANAALIHTEPSAAAPDPKRRRLPLVALLALLALGLAGAATAIALVRPEKGTSSGTATEAIFQTLTTTAAGLATDTIPTTDGQKTTTAKNHNTPPPAHTSSGAATTTTKRPSLTRPTTTAAAANMVHKKHKQVAPRPKPVTIADNFAGNQIDGTIWTPIRFGTGWNMTVQSASLQFAFSPSSTPAPPYNNFGGHLATLCQFPGDFDARVDYTLVTWPTSNGIGVTLDAFLGPKNIGWSSWRRSSAQWGEQYGSYTGTATSVSLADTSGMLRLARRRGTITAYFLHSGRWDALTSGHNTLPATIAIGAYGGGGSTNGPFGGQNVVVNFNHFTVTGTNPSCPPGAKVS